MTIERQKVKPRYCAHCGKELVPKEYPNSHECPSNYARRKYCDINCMRKGFVIRDGSKQRWGPAHSSARKIVHLIEQREVKCSMCGSTHNVDIHHKDGNHQNNDSSNLVLLCRSCHIKAHRPKSKCKICGKECKTTLGMCDKHYFRWKKYGDPNHKPWSTYKEKYSKGPIHQYSLDGTLIATFPTLRDAAKVLPYARSSIACACNGSRKTLGGYIWRYAD